MCIDTERDREETKTYTDINLFYVVCTGLTIFRGGCIRKLRTCICTRRGMGRKEVFVNQLSFTHVGL